MVEVQLGACPDNLFNLIQHHVSVAMDACGDVVEAQLAVEQLDDGDFVLGLGGAAPDKHGLGLLNAFSLHMLGNQRQKRSTVLGGLA